MFNPEIRKFYDAGDAASGALSGASMGAALGPWGALAGGVIGGAVGFFQKKKGNALLKNTVRPTEQVPAEVLANQQLAQQAADEGLPSEQYQQGIKNIQRQQAGAISSAQDRRLGGALIPAIEQGGMDATGNLDVASAQARTQNRKTLMGVNADVGQWRNKVWDWNQRQKYITDYNYAQSLIGQGNQNLMGGIDKITSGVVGAANSGAFSGGGSNSSSGAPSYMQQSNPYGSGGPQTI